MGAEGGCDTWAHLRKGWGNQQPAPKPLRCERRCEMCDCYSGCFGCFGLGRRDFTFIVYFIGLLCETPVKCKALACKPIYGAKSQSSLTHSKTNTGSLGLSSVRPDQQNAQCGTETMANAFCTCAEPWVNEYGTQFDTKQWRRRRVAIGLLTPHHPMCFCGSFTALNLPLPNPDTKALLRGLKFAPGGKQIRGGSPSVPPHVNLPPPPSKWRCQNYRSRGA